MSDGPRARVLASPNRLKLAAFAFNLNGGGAISLAEGTVEATWPESKRIALAAERANIEAVIPLGRWGPYPGTTIGRKAFETLSWAAAVAAVTEVIDVFATVHTFSIHPVRLAKTIATIDEISGGRFGINLVTGWVEGEFKMFGLDALPHDERYDYADELVSAIKRLAHEDAPVDFAGRYFRFLDGHTEPKPLQRPFPVVMSAANSPRGRSFAMEHADMSFINYDNAEHAAELAAQTKRDALERFGREIKVWSACHIVCADTQREAEEYFDYCVRVKGDRAGAEVLVREILGGVRSDVGSRTDAAPREHDRATLEAFIDSFIAGWGGVPLVGSPEHIVERLQEISDAGIDGLTVSWFDYDAGIETFRTRILPLMIEAGLRVDEGTPAVGEAAVPSAVA
jgi:alkanesulfonate monooxygenase SsuD/methylene tetrahydromethanopterin reductase-like flavin-dependent oxidoreductase (luciferase family)